ncbi:MAG: phosphotransferase [Actinomycetota bacterium]|nr:phosphotransferase [Actinomycetota bacterium]
MASVRAALARVDGRLRALPLRLGRQPDLAHPAFAQGHAWVDGWMFAKLAFSKPTAARIWHEARVVDVLGELAFPVPQAVQSSRDPALVMTRRVEGGVPLSFDLVASATPEAFASIADGLAGFLARLHSTDTFELLRERLDGPLRSPDPGLQATTEALRQRFAPLVEPHQREFVAQVCDWTDQQLAAPAEAVFVHGDFHPYNQLWDIAQIQLLAVTDFESSGVAEPEYDFRVLPVYGPGIDLLLATVDQYVALTGRALNVERILALFVRTYLGDALWRTEAGIGLPEPGATPSEYVDELAERFALLGIVP